MSRAEVRKAMDERVRLTLLEVDMDEVESGLKTIKALLTGILISTATASILLALNLITQGGP